jgi:hypothetical protein
MSDPIHILSLGAGVQSSTMALMAASGEITPMPQCAIFADTQAEPKSVYAWLDWLENQLPFPVRRVTAGNLEADALRVRQRKDGKGSWVPSGVPHYSINADGSKGHGPRQCTGDFKLNPIIKEQRQQVIELLPDWRRIHRFALKELRAYEAAMRVWKRCKKAGIECVLPVRPEGAWMECQSDALVIAMIGISWDEALRMKPALRPWIRNYYPFVERKITRHSCLLWMEKRGFPRPPRSACVFCPYHSDVEWLRLKTEEPQEFQRAVEFERAYQAAKSATVSRKGFIPFLHDSRQNLDTVVFDGEDTVDFFQAECQGMCGL